MSDLIKVTKAGVVLGVHPTCLAAHEAAGWTRTEAEINAGLPEAVAPKALSDLKVADLKALAAERGVDLGDATTKADIVAAIELHAEASAENPAE